MKQSSPTVKVAGISPTLVVAASFFFAALLRGGMPAGEGVDKDEWQNEQARDRKALG